MAVCIVCISKHNRATSKGRKLKTLRTRKLARDVLCFISFLIIKQREIYKRDRKKTIIFYDFTKNWKKSNRNRKDLILHLIGLVATISKKNKSESR